MLQRLTGADVKGEVLRGAICKVGLIHENEFIIIQFIIVHYISLTSTSNYSGFSHKLVSILTVNFYFFR